MAKVSLYEQKSRGKVGYRLQFSAPKSSPNDPRLSLWLGTDVTKTKAESFATFMDCMVDALNDDKAFDKRTRNWLLGLNDRDHAKLAKLGLCDFRKPVVVEPAEVHTLKTFVDRFMLTIIRQKPATKTKLRQAGERLVSYFGGEREVGTITAGDAEEWASWMATSGNVREGKERTCKDGSIVQGKTTLSENTVRRHSGLSKQIFGFAIKLRWIKENPFEQLVAAVGANEERMFFVDHATIKKVIEMAPDARWRAIIALARFGGLRIPSELAGLRWCDVAFASGRLKIHSPKTEHIKGKGIRFCPLFPELRLHLEELAMNEGIDTDIDPTSTARVFDKYRTP